MDAEEPKPCLLALLLSQASGGGEDLSKLKVSELLQKARAAGVPKAALDDVYDAKNPKAVVLALLTAAAPAAAAAPPAEDLSKLKVSELLQKARAAGVPKAALADVYDAEDPKAAVLTLLTTAPAVAAGSSSAARIQLYFKLTEEQWFWPADQVRRRQLASALYLNMACDPRLAERRSSLAGHHGCRRASRAAWPGRPAHFPRQGALTTPSISLQ
jgi:hypothetical protein